LVEFFVKFLTDEGDLVFDPFGGSNTTGAVAETLSRRWVSCEANLQYVTSSLGRFDRSDLKVVGNIPIDNEQRTPIGEAVGLPLVDEQSVPAEG
jgi:DNA modification methylase